MNDFLKGAEQLANGCEETLRILTKFYEEPDTLPLTINFLKSVGFDIYRRPGEDRGNRVPVVGCLPRVNEQHYKRLKLTKYDKPYTANEVAVHLYLPKSKYVCTAEKILLCRGFIVVVTRKLKPIEIGCPGGLHGLTPIQFAHQFKDCIDYMHKHDMVHGDVKWDNVVYDPETQHIALIDFGCSAIVGSRCVWEDSGRGLQTPDIVTPKWDYIMLRDSLEDTFPDDAEVLNFAKSLIP